MKAQSTPSLAAVDQPRLVRLLPCPFCGTDSGTPTGPRYLKNGDMWEGMMHDVHCINCTTTMSDYSREKVEAKWNLRSLPNTGNVGPLSNDTSGHRGVTWDKRRGKWWAQGMRDGRMINLGRYSDLEEAAAVAQAWREENFGIFAAT